VRFVHVILFNANFSVSYDLYYSLRNTNSVYCIFQLYKHIYYRIEEIIQLNVVFMSDLAVYGTMFSYHDV